MHYTENYSNYYPKKKLRTMGHITPSMDYYPRKFQIVDTNPPLPYAMLPKVMKIAQP